MLFGMVQYSPENVLRNECDNVTDTSANYWLMYNGIVNTGFVLDRGCTENFNEISMKNTNNADLNDRYEFFFVNLDDKIPS